jgi:hypothetical protein
MFILLGLHAEARAHHIKSAEQRRLHDGIDRHIGIEQYHRPIDAAALFWLYRRLVNRNGGQTHEHEALTRSDAWDTGRRSAPGWPHRLQRATAWSDSGIEADAFAFG